MADGTNAMIAVGHRQGDTLRLGPADQETSRGFAIVNLLRAVPSRRCAARHQARCDTARPECGRGYDQN
jgi:hypothetical protein